MSPLSSTSRSLSTRSDLPILAAALANIPGSNAIRVRQGQALTRGDAMQSLLFTLSLMTAAQRKSRSQIAGNGVARPRNSAA